MRIASLSAVLLLSLSACTFVKMGPGAAQVQVVAQDKDMRACEKVGEIEVSVKDRLGPYERDEMRVLDELETLARNEAPDLHADAIQPKGPPTDGGQRFMAFRCAGAKAASPEQAGDSAETVPLKD
jgi:Domain of unknown function (DUF4156)